MPHQEMTKAATSQQGGNMGPRLHACDVVRMHAQFTVRTSHPGPSPMTVLEPQHNYNIQQ